ncbi:MAG: hypothetical protein GDA48_07950 [Hormoscilla sp. GM102CHS1]|nr:hypothetical protein [Hormoscilla sp. GM102CHS1]
MLVRTKVRTARSNRWPPPGFVSGDTHPCRARVRHGWVLSETIGKSLGDIPWVVLKALPRDAKSENGCATLRDRKVIGMG